ncbi:MAG: hypothetical protein K1X94_13390 [Sandaracinaceae bacterium]|nr:hypothetical protein [Sandaracinaceae bacterium]
MRELEPLLREGWPTAAACLLGAIAMLAGLRSALHRTELALRDKLVVVLAAGGLATAGIAPQLLSRPDQMASTVAGIASDHPLAIAGAVFAVALGFVAIVLAWWVRYWVRTMIRMAMLGAFLLTIAAWCLARFLLVGFFDGWSGAHLGAEGWRAILDGGGVASLVLGVLWLLRARPPKEHEA